MTHICVSKTCHNWLKKWLVAWSAPTHYLNQCCYITDSTIRNTFPWNIFYSKFGSFHSRKCTSNVACKLAAILSRPQCIKLNVWSVKGLHLPQHTTTHVGRRNLIRTAIFTKVTFVTIWGRRRGGGGDFSHRNVTKLFFAAIQRIMSYTYGIIATHSKKN